MREFTSPDGVDIAPSENAVTILLDNARRWPHRSALATKHDGRWIDVSTAELAATVRELAAGFVALGVQPGDRVCVFMRTRIEFTYLDYAIWAAGACTVTIYETSSPEQVEWIVGNSGAVAIVCGDGAQRVTFDTVAKNLPDCRNVVVVDDGGLESLRRAGNAVAPQDVDRRIEGIRADDLATLVYTSGTTGRPKGCMITHGNFVFAVREAVAELGDVFLEGGSTLMFLPLAHIFARVMEVGCVSEGMTIAYNSDMSNLMPELGEVRPTLVFSVPRIFEKIFTTAQAGATGSKRRVFDAAVETAIRWSKAKEAGRVPPLLALRRALFDRLVYGHLRAVFGGALRFAVSGGAPLGDRLGHFFHGAGILVLEGYGLTETTAAATMNTPAHYRIGTVGRPIPRTSVRIADDGEVLLKGGNIFSGYWRNDAATADVISADGWFATGDIGELDADGFLRITGRKKELIVTAGGKNVAPAVLEDRIRAHPLVSQAVVVGDQRPFVAALVTLDSEELARWPGSDTGELSGSEALRSEIQKAIDDANAAVSKAESIREFRILEQDFTIASGELTPTLKLKRNVVVEKYTDLIESMYTR
jgi:long-chain acyl-CoA synthetase